MKTEEAIKIIKQHGHKYTDKRRDMLNIFVDEDKYINAKHIQRGMDQHYPGISLILFIETYIYLRNLILLKALN